MRVRSRGSMPGVKPLWVVVTAVQKPQAMTHMPVKSPKKETVACSDKFDSQYRIRQSGSMEQTQLLVWRTHTGVDTPALTEQVTFAFIYLMEMDMQSCVSTLKDPMKRDVRVPFTPMNLRISCKNDQLGWNMLQMIAVKSSQMRCMCVTAPQNLNLKTGQHVNVENNHEECLLSALEDFSPQLSPNPADFSDSDRDEREEEEPLGFGVRPYMFEPLCTAGKEREREREPAHPRDVWYCTRVDN